MFFSSGTFTVSFCTGSKYLDERAGKDFGARIDNFQFKRESLFLQRDDFFSDFGQVHDTPRFRVNPYYHKPMILRL